MSIVIVTGPAGSGKTTTANALRNSAISAKRGALLVDEDQTGEPKHLLEKILAGEPFPDVVDDAAALPWKPNPTIIMVGAQAEMLDTFEQMAPGFTELHGPVYRITTG